MKSEDEPAENISNFNEKHLFQTGKCSGAYTAAGLALVALRAR